MSKLTRRDSIRRFRIAYAGNTFRGLKTTMSEQETFQLDEITFDEVGPPFT